MEEEEPEGKEAVFSPMKENSSERNGREASFF